MSKQEKLDYVYYEKKKENIMSVQTDFEKEFETEEYEMLILVQASCGGAVCIKDMLKPSVDFLASIDLRNGQFFHEKGRVEWLIKKDNKRKGWGYDFEQFGIYRVVVRKCIPQKLQPYQLHYMNNRYRHIGIAHTPAPPFGVTTYSAAFHGILLLKAGRREHNEAGQMLVGTFCGAEITPHG